MRRRFLSGGVAVGISILSSIAAFEAARPVATGWHEIAWPFPRDGWPPGRAYHCNAAVCGDDMDVFVRPKLGFCNCDSGVADDDEVDRVADLDLLSDRFVPLAPGQVISVAGMAGRARSYDLQKPDGSRRNAVGIAASRHCDLMVAVVLGNGVAPNLTQCALEFLGSGAMAGWISAAMAGRLT